LLDELDAANNGLENTRAKIVSLNALGMLKTNDIIHFYDDQQTMIDSKYQRKCDAMQSSCLCQPTQMKEGKSKRLIRASEPLPQAAETPSKF
jgi:hypothetical protein